MNECIKRSIILAQKSIRYEKRGLIPLTSMLDFLIDLAN